MQNAKQHFARVHAESAAGIRGRKSPPDGLRLVDDGALPCRPLAAPGLLTSPTEHFGLAIENSCTTHPLPPVCPGAAGAWRMENR